MASTRTASVISAMYVALMTLATPEGARAQHAATHAATHADSARAGFTIGAMGIAAMTRVDPASRGIARTEGYLTQPMLMAQWRSSGGGAWGVATIDAEGLVLRRGELNPGTYGEGYIDRRHPHTYMHELILGVGTRMGSVHFTLGGGKGFAPFGTDDPMSRPFVKYPANHHLAQVLERLMIIGAARRGAVRIEAATFNGDEPEGPGDWPDASRFGDSWAVRASLAPAPAFELQTSFASVVSPEDAQGFGLDQRKRSASLRWESPLSYALVEYAETDEYARTRLTYTFWSALAEAQRVLGPVTLAARIERTVRPEEERTIDDFRSARPLLDFNILGRTRWDLVSVSVGANQARFRSLRIVPFAEAMYGRPSATRRNPIFDPRVFYGASGVWSLTAGARVHVGTMRSRMGRYGAAVAESSGMAH